MIFETIESAGANPLVKHQPVLQRALRWATDEAPHRETGTYELEGREFFAMVQQRESKPRSERPTPEVHQRFVDLQLCLGGGEIIDWYPAEKLVEAATAYDVEKDVELFQRPDGIAPVELYFLAGRFALFFPEDGHVPIVSDGVHAGTRMVVFKIALALF